MANRGATFERLVDMANTKYRNAGVADIRKVPTPVQITKSKGRLVEGRKETAERVGSLEFIKDVLLLLTRRKQDFHSRIYHHISISCLSHGIKRALSSFCW